MKAGFFLFSGVSWRAGCPGTDNPSVCFCLCVHMCVCNTSRTVKVSSFPLWQPFGVMKESWGGVERRGCLYFLLRCMVRSKVDPMATDVPVAEQRP